MKKIGIGVLSVSMLLAGCFALANPFAYADEAAPTQKTCEVETIEQLQTALEGDYNKITLKDNINATAGLNVSKFKTFKGVFDGNGYAIHNLKIEADDGSDQTNETYTNFAILPQAENATIKNLKLTGNLIFDLRNMDTTGGYVGGFVGQGVNTKIENCHLDLDKIQEVYTESYVDEDSQPQTRDSVRDEIHIDKSMTFGAFAGRISINGDNSFISQCIADYSAGFYFDKLAEISIGGLAGRINNAAITNTINFANITFNGQANLAAENTLQYIGGAVGHVSGIVAEVRNVICAGEVTANEAYTKSISTNAGAIIGGTDIAEQYKNNIRYDYFLQNGINPTGDGSIAIRTNLQQLQSVKPEYTAITKDVLSDMEIFDTELPKFDFDTKWDYKNSEILLQEFQNYEFRIPLTFDASPEHKVIENAYFVDYSDENSKEFKYGKPVKIQIKLKEEAKGWFENLKVFKNTREEVAVTFDKENVDGVWEFSLPSNASTAGQYTFSVSQKTYSATVETADFQQGGVRTSEADKNSSSERLAITFSYSNKSRTVVAQSKGAFAFDHWDMYLKVDGEWSTTPVERLTEGANANQWKDVGLVWNSENLVLEYDPNNAVLKNEFKVIACYTEDPALVNFNFDSNYVTAISLNALDYSGTELRLAKRGTVPLRITVKKGYELDVEELKKEIKRNVNKVEYEIPVTFQNESVVDALGNTTYIFNIDMSKMDYAVFAEGLTINLKTHEAAKENDNALLWLWITLPIVAVVAAGVVTLVVLLRRRNQLKGGGRGGKTAKKSKAEPAKPKAESYKDYYI